MIFENDLSGALFGIFAQPSLANQIGHFPLINQKQKPMNPKPNTNPTALHTWSLNSNERELLGSDPFQEFMWQRARRLVAVGAGEFAGPMGRCRVLIQLDGGSAIIRLAATDEAIALALVTWSPRGGAHARYEFQRIIAEQGGSPAGLPEPGDLEPRITTFIFPLERLSLSAEAAFLVETTFWVLGLALIEHLQPTPKPPGN